MQDKASSSSVERHAKNLGMTIASTIGPFLPLLRRFARALSGSQPVGDGYVASTLEMILADAASFDAALDPRVALYKTFLRVWRTCPARSTGSARASADEAAVMRSLAAFAIAPRVAFLLNTLESFEPVEIADILECDEVEARSLLQRAEGDIAAQMRTNVLIIEDEPLIALDLLHIVRELGHSAEKVARTQIEAVAVAMKTQPGLILADIQLADGSSGLDAVNEILGKFPASVIFITAFPERLLTGKAPEPAFLITKPFNAGAVKAAISQALFFDRKSTSRSTAGHEGLPLQPSEQKQHNQHD